MFHKNFSFHLKLHDFNPIKLKANFIIFSPKKIINFTITTLFTI